MARPSGLRKTRPVPQRTCVACRRTDAKQGLIRVVRNAEGQVVVDPTGRLNGRGAYLCPEITCWEVALKRHHLERALRVASIEPDVSALLLAYVRDLETTKI
ncbi:MAG: YlxR family protein [Chloroflexia bacterium]|nr:YlxR family protein [Chloroflexia bacterium]